MNKTQKEQLVSELKSKINGATALYFTDFTGLNVKRMTDLRRRLRKANVEYVVIKNTLALRAVSESGLVSTRLKGQTGLVIAKDGQAERLKKMGVTDLKRVYTEKDLAPADDLLFVATGVTDGAFMRGVRFFGNGVRTSSILMSLRERHTRSG